MRKLFVLLLACMLCGAFVLTGCSGADQENTSQETGTEVAEEGAAGTEVTQAELEEKIIGRWMASEIDGRPALTNEKAVFTFESPTRAHISAAFNSRPKHGDPWIDGVEADCAITDQKITLTWPIAKDETIVDEVSVSTITDTETQGTVVVKKLKDGKESVITEQEMKLVRVSEDYSKAIIGTWEGQCTSKGSPYDDGKMHRWEYKADGTYVYYEQKGDKWMPGDDTLNEYFVAGNLLCTRWVENDKENREWWELSIADSKMKWTALREDKDGKTSTVTFEMTRVEG